MVIGVGVGVGGGVAVGEGTMVGVGVTVGAAGTRVGVGADVGFAVGADAGFAVGAGVGCFTCLAGAAVGTGFGVGVDVGRGSGVGAGADVAVAGAVSCVAVGCVSVFTSASSPEEQPIAINNSTTTLIPGRKEARTGCVAIYFSIGALFNSHCLMIDSIRRAPVNQPFVPCKIRGSIHAHLDIAIPLP